MTASMALPKTMTASMALPKTMTASMALPKTLKGQVVLSQTITSRCKEIEIELENINNKIEERMPEIKGNGDYICEDTIHPYAYQGSGLVGIHSAMKVQLNMMKHIIKEVCFIADEFDDTIAGNIIIPKCDTNDTVPGIRQAFGDEDDTLIGGLFDDTISPTTNQIVFAGKGVKGINSQVNALMATNKIIAGEICKHKGSNNAYPVYADPHLEEFPILRQLTFTLVETRFYPYQEGSLWHMTIPLPRPNLDWEDFEQLQFFKGSVYGRIIWQNSKIWSGGYFRDEAEARRVLTMMENYSTLSKSGDFRFGKGGNPRKPQVREVRAVRAVVADLNPTTGDPETVLAFVPPER